MTLRHFPQLKNSVQRMKIAKLVLATNPLLSIINDVYHDRSMIIRENGPLKAGTS